MEELYERMAEYMPLDINIVSSSKEQTCIFILCTKDNKDKVFEALRGMDFILPSITTDISPAEQLSKLKDQFELSESNY